MNTYAVSPEDIARIEGEPQLWLYTLFPSYVSSTGGEPIPFAPHHRAFLDWLWGITLDTSPDPMADIEIWPRGGAKSTLAELATVAVAARQRRRYGIYVCDTQDQADDHVGNISGMLQSPAFELFYPEASSRRRIGMVGKAVGRGVWRRNRLQTSGFTIDALGLDTATRGIKVDEDRPDWIVFDDIDKDVDSATVTARKRRLLSRSIIPARARHAAFLGIQNLILHAGIFASLARGTADLLLDRRVGGPVPALEGFDPDQHLERSPGELTYRIVAGPDGSMPRPTWAGQDLAECEAQINAMGVEAFMLEAQHSLGTQDDRVFSSFDPTLHRYPYSRLPEFLDFFGGLDFGGEGLTAHWSTGAIIGVTRQHRRVLLDVFKDRGPNVTERQMRWMLEMQAKWRGGSGERIRYAADRSQGAAIVLLRNSGFRVRRSRQGGEDGAGRETRIRALGQVLAREALTRAGDLRTEGPPTATSAALPGFFYLPRLGDFEDEMLSYRREQPPAPDVPSQRRPIRVNDDVIDAVLYCEELIARVLLHGDEEELPAYTAKR